MRCAARIAIFGACALCVTPGWTQVYPAKPVRIVVGFSAGSTTDLIGRVLATKMGEGLGQPVVVDNRPGAGANIAAVLPEVPTVAEPAPSTPERAGTYLRSETEKYARVVKAIGLRID